MAASDDLKRKILDQGGPPRHVAIIMDGNGRWARRRMLPRIMGHREGRKAVRRVVEAGADLGLEVLTLFTFSIENWQRPRDEVRSLMQYLEEVLESEFLYLEKNNIRLTSMGRLDILPERTRAALRETERRLAAQTGMVLNLAISYSGRAEIVDACRAVAREAAAGTLDPAALDEEALAQRLYLPQLGNVDLLIRTSGEQRISNFCLWQLAYAEIHLTDTLWPDFGKDDFHRAILDYQGRERRFGRVT